ncbi:MAG: SDR family NAD(P)-dependent oxidoreductase [Actinomycetota bacterium]|nr:SDR family NAD(P)-dependent oxidoreductase [Actinomycetota bacterium]
MSGLFCSPDFTRSAAVVTGGGRGIGAAIARAYAAAGARVTIDGRQEASLKAVCDEIVTTGGEAYYVVGDVTDPSHLEELMAAAASEYGRIDVLVNNAGIPGPTAPLDELTLEDWNETLTANLTSVFLACRAALPYLRRADRAKIVNIGSVTGKRPLPNRTPYAAAKLGVVGLSRTLAHELGPDGISVNTISPWLVGGDRLTQVVESMAHERALSNEELWAEFTDGTVFKRPVQEEDIARLALMLGSSAADNITGQDLNVSAGAVMY